MSKKKRCPACGATIVWKMNQATGRWIPAQPIKTIYAEWDHEDQITTSSVVGMAEYDGLPTPQLYISHFETCSDPGRFSKRTKVDQPKEKEGSNA